MVTRQTLAVAYVSAEKPEELPLQARQAHGKDGDFREREPTQLHRIQSDRVAKVAFVVDGAQADDLAREMKAKDLFAAIAIDPARFDRTATHCGDCIE